MLKETVIAMTVVTFAAAAAPGMAGDSGSGPLVVASDNPCNPCHPCNPCKPCNPCNPCKAE
ncbi:MAG: hypothetical protein AB7X20_05050 [Alphaproteobacteria bacterium]